MDRQTDGIFKIGILREMFWVVENMVLLFAGRLMGRI